MANIMRKIFASDIEAAIKRAREDERQITIKSEEMKWQREIDKITGEYTLKLKEAEARVNSMEMRMAIMDEQIRKMEIERQQLRELAVQQRRITSDLVHVIKYYLERRMEEMQPFLRLESEAEKLEKLLLNGGQDDKN